MTKKELTLTIIVVAGLFFTAMTSAKKESFDCYQAVFSKSSTCSINGQACVLVQNRAGFTGLFNNFKGLFIEISEKDTFLKCDPNCSIKFSNESLHHLDSVMHTHQ